MKNDLYILITGLLFTLLNLTGCNSPTPPAQITPPGDYLLLSQDSTGANGYRNEKGDLVIPFGKYPMCLTDTFKTHAIVFTEKGFVVIDRQEQVLYEVFNYDNGPDYPSEGLFRIVQNGKMGYADAATYRVVIEPQFDCAFPFENGTARVSNNCTVAQEGEHKIWNSDEWKEIDKLGNDVQ